MCQCTVPVPVCSVMLSIFPFDWHVRSTFPVNRWMESLTSSLSFTVDVSFGEYISMHHEKVESQERKWARDINLVLCVWGGEM